MALPKSGKTGSNVTKLDEARKERSQKIKPSKSSKSSKSSAATGRSAKSLSAVHPTKADKHRKKNNDIQPDDDSTKVIKKSVTKVEKTKAATKSKTEPRVSNRRFDKVKVERIKSEIASGNYTINYLNVADKFIEHERYA